MMQFSGQHASWQIRSTCSACNMKRITAYTEDIRYLTEQVPFRCKHGRDVTGLRPTDVIEEGKIAVPRSGMVQLGLAERISRK